MSFNYQSADAWTTSTDTLLPVGNHVVTISNPQMTESSSKNPQIELRIENPQGSMRDWVVITPKTVGKVVQLYDAAGVQRPEEGEFDEHTGRLTDRCVDRLHNKKVGVVVREEPDYNDASKMRRRIAGYVTPDQVTSDAPADTAGLPAAGTHVPAGAFAHDDSVPF